MAGSTRSFESSVERQTAYSTVLERVFTRVAPSLYRFAAMRESDVSAVDDLMQQLWLQASRSARQVPEAELEVWFRAILRNLIRSQWRTQRRRPGRTALDDPAVDRQLAEQFDQARLPSSVVSRREVREQVARALSSLSHAHQELIVAHYYRGASQVQMALQLGTSARAIEGRLYRARQALREQLEQVGLSSEELS